MFLGHVIAIDKGKKQLVLGFNDLIPSYSWEEDTEFQGISFNPYSEIPLHMDAAIIGESCSNSTPPNPFEKEDSEWPDSSPSTDPRVRGSIQVMSYVFFPQNLEFLTIVLLETTKTFISSLRINLILCLLLCLKHLSMYLLQEKFHPHVNSIEEGGSSLISPQSCCLNLQNKPCPKNQRMCRIDLILVKAKCL